MTTRPEQVGGNARGGTADLVTLVVPARNEEQALPGCLYSLLAQDWPNLEVLVVDGASTDNTAQVVLDIAALDPRVRLIRNPQRIIPVSLNLALEAAKGRWLVRVDAHAVVPPDYVGIAVRHLATGSYGGVGGRKDGVGRTPAGRAIAATMKSRFGVGGSTYHWGTTVRPVEHVPFGAYPVQLLRDIDGWDESLRVNQDFELDFRLRKLGHAILFDPAMGIDWECRQSVAALYKQYKRYGGGKAIVAVKHPTSLRPRHLAAPGLVTTLLLLFLTSILQRNPKPFLLGLASYLMALTGATLLTARSLDREARPYVAPAFIAMHLGWGTGFIGANLRILYKLLRRKFG